MSRTVVPVYPRSANRALAAAMTRCFVDCGGVGMSKQAFKTAVRPLSIRNVTRRAMDRYTIERRRDTICAAGVAVAQSRIVSRLVDDGTSPPPLCPQRHRGTPEEQSLQVYLPQCATQ